MARCGCSGAVTCGCFLSAGTNVTITGNGNSGTPFIINASQNPISVANTATVGLVLASNVLTANVKLDTASGNLLTATANGIRLDCAAITSCLTASGVTTIADTATINMSISGAGTSGSPYVISGQVILDPAGIATISAAGVLVSAAAINAAITVSGGSWPYSCPETSASPIYKNAITGALHGDAPVTSNSVSNSGGTGSGTFAGSNATLDTMTINLTNPSSCRTAIYTATWTSQITTTAATTAAFAIGMGPVGLASAVDLLKHINTGAGTETGAMTSVSFTTVGTLAAGATAVATSFAVYGRAITGSPTWTASVWQVAVTIVNV